MSGVWQQPIVRVLGSTDGAKELAGSGASALVIGTGALVLTPQFGACVLTAAHVVNAALGWAPYATGRPESNRLIRFDLPAKRPGLSFVARVVQWEQPRSATMRTENPVSDIALLQVLASENDSKEALPGDLRLFRPEDFAVVADADLDGLSLHSFGFLRPDGAFAEGKVQGAVASGWLHLVATSDKGDFIAPGFSGAPMFDATRQRILGMAIAIAPDDDRRLAFLQSTLNIWKACPELARPYPGLRAFEERDAPFFYGRDAFVTRMLEKTRVCPLLGVTAASGSGKSSAIRAGLIPKLRGSEDTLLLVMRPLTDPWKQLALAITRLASPEADTLTIDDQADSRARLLRESPQKLLDYAQGLLAARGARRLTIFVDQFEELFTLAGHEREERPEGGNRESKKVGQDDKAPRNPGPDFRDLMASTAQLQVSPHVQWIYALRGDFAGRAFKHRAFVDCVGDGDVKLADMTPNELHDAISRPAQALRVGFEAGTATEPGLIGRIAEDAGATAGALPLMQHVLDQLWREMRNRRLTHEAYDGLGGLRGALNLHADRVFYALSKEDQLLARRLFSRLVNVEENGEATRRVATRGELQKEQQDTVWALAQKLAGEDSRLLTLGGEAGSEGGVARTGAAETVEVAHEALLRDWGKLKDWIAEDRRFLLWRRRLEQQLRDHQDAGDKTGTWLTGGPLQLAISWRASRVEDLGKEELEFINASENVEKEAANLKAEIARREQRRSKQLISALLVIVFGAVIAAIGGLWLWNSQKIATEKIGETLIKNEEARKQAFSANAMLAGNIADREIEGSNYGTAIALSLEFLKSPERDQEKIIPELLRPLYASTLFNREYEPLVHTDEVTGFSITNDERTLVSTTNGGGICIWDLEKKLVRAAFSPKGERTKLPNLQVCSITQRVSHPTSEFTLEVDPVQKTLAEISPDGSYIAYANNKQLKLLETSSLLEVKTIGSTNPIVALSFGPRSNELFYATGGGGVTVAGMILEREKDWAEKGLEPITKCEGGGEILWSQDQSLIFLDSQPVQCVWYRRTTRINTFDVDPEDDFRASMSDNGSLAVVSLELTKDKFIKIVNPISGKVKAKLPVIGEIDDLEDVTIAPDGKNVAIVEDHGVMSLWDFHKKQRLDVSASRASAIAFSNSSQIMIRIFDDQIDVWRMRDKEKIAVLGGHHSSFGRVIIGARDDKIFAVSDENIRVFSLRQNNDYLRTFLGHSGPSEAEFDDKDNVLISLDWTPAIRSFDALSGAEKGILPIDLMDLVVLDKADSIYRSNKNTVEIISKLNFNRKDVVPFEHNVMDLVVDPAGRWFVATDDAGDIYLRSNQSQPKKIGSGSISMSSDVIVAPSGDKFAVKQADGKVAFFSSSGTPITPLKRINELNAPPDEVVWDLKGEKVAVTTTYGLSRIDADRESSFQIWNMASEAGTDWSKSQNLPSLVRSFAWNPKQAIAAVGMQNGSVAIWNDADKTIKTIWKEHGDSVNKLSWSPDGKWLVSEDDSKTIVRDWQTGEKLDVRSRPISSKPSDKSERENILFPTTKASVNSVAFSPDVRLMATISVTGESIDLIDISSRSQIAKLEVDEEPLEGQDAPDATVKFSDDGKWLISTHIGKSVRVWKVWKDLEELEQVACRSWSGPLTDTERVQLNLTPNKPALCSLP